MPRRTRRWSFRIAALLALILAIGFGWHHLWQRAAGALDNEVTRQIRRANDSGREIGCVDRRVEGYPFRVGIFCDSVSAHSDRDGFTLRAGAFRSAAQFYQPNRVIAELDGPLLVTELSGRTHAATWQSLRASARLDLAGVNRISIETRELDIESRETGFGARLAGAEFHLRPTPEDSRQAVDIAFLLDRVEPGDGAVQPWPAFALSADLRVDGLRDELRPGFDLARLLRQEGISGDIRRAQILPLAGGDTTLSGTFDVSATGLLGARLKVEAADPGAMLRFLAPFFPDRPESWKQLEQAVTLLAALGASGGGKLTLDVRIDDGEVRIGPFAAGRIPPLF
ncbi:MAG: DUF2125 domain-containing protein [Pseudomonadota bacterium]|nr:DUF2125 domain-containing protein [Pseudomonadota bacterium]